jgi:aspartyl/asparaginyl-tRNA synthetase
MIKFSGYVTNYTRLKSKIILKIIDTTGEVPGIVQVVVDGRLPNCSGQWISVWNCKPVFDQKECIREYTCESDNLRCETSTVDQPFQLCAIKCKSTLGTEIVHRYHSLKLLKNQLKFRAVGRVLHRLRCSLVQSGFVEIQTPKIMGYGSEGGSQVFCLNYFGRRAYLAQSPQLYKQQAVISGLSRVFETNYVYRAELSRTNRHLTQAYCLDCQMITNGMSGEQGLVYIQTTACNLIGVAHEEITGVKPIFKTISYEKAVVLCNEKFELLQGEDLEKQHIQHLINQLSCDYLVVDYFPVCLRPFYILRSNSEWTYGFDLFNKNMELISGGQREYRHERLILNLIQKSIDPESVSPYLQAFKNSTIPHGGFSIGFARLMMGLCEVDNIRDIVLFPRDPDLLKP